MPSYKLTYFDARGYAEPARLLFKLAGVQFQDNRVNHEDGSWEQYKDSTPFGKIPVLTVDGFDIPQSAAIIRYLANKFGYAGKTPEEEAWADAIADQYKDYMNAFLQYVMAQHAGEPAEKVELIKTEVFLPARDVYFKILNGLLEKSKSGFLVGNGLTFADLVIAENVTNLVKNHHITAEEQPALVAFRDRIYEIPAIKEWVAIRPDTQF